MQWLYHLEQVSKMSRPVVRVTGTNYVRDVNSMGLSNTNSVEKDEYYAKQKLMQVQKQELNNIKSDQSIFTDRNFVHPKTIDQVRQNLRRVA